MGRNGRRRGDAVPTGPDGDVLVVVPDFTKIQLGIGKRYSTKLVITGWIVSDGGQIDSDAPLLTISSDKADIEVTSPACGVLEIVADLNSEVQIGEIVAIIHPDRPAIADPSP